MFGAGSTGPNVLKDGKDSMKKATLKGRLLFTLVLLPLSVSADPQWGVKVDPVVIIPFDNPSGLVQGGKSVDLYSVGYGLGVTANMNLAGFFSPFVNFDINNIPLNGVSGSSLVSEQFGGGLSVFAYPLPRLVTSVGLGGGAGLTSFTSSNSGSAESGLATYWKAVTEFGYRFAPGFNVSGLAGYTQTLGSKSAIFKGFDAGVRLDIGLDMFGGGESTVDLNVTKQDILFPITYYKSAQVPLGSVRLVNNDAAELRDIKVTFTAGGYTARAAECGRYDILLHGDHLDVPLYAAFNDKVLGFTESTKIQGEIKVEYRILDASKTATKAVTVVFNSRNSASWADARMVGAFISPQDPVMLELSKYVAGLVRVRAIPEIDKSLQYGMGIFEGLRVYGLVWNADPSAPYSQVRNDMSRLAYVQYPAQTLSFKSGDSDALALTVAEALESIAVPAAIAAFPDDVIVAFPLDMGESQAKATFSNQKNFIFDSGTVWVPLRASLIRDGFLRAWEAGAELWYSTPEESRPALIRVEDAWKEFTPVPIASDLAVTKPAEDAVDQAFDTVLGRFASAEVEPKINRIMASVNGEVTGTQANSMGVVYAQYGFYDKAKEQFEKAVSLGYNQAVINLANIAFLKKDFEEAAKGFEEALESRPDNKNVLLGLARARYELGDYDAANTLFLKVKTIDPALAERYSYLAAKVGG
jgi:tetratricopeptide (TPR) repeat protein